MDVQALGQLADMQGAGGGAPMEDGPMGGPPAPTGPAAGPPQGGGNPQAMQQGLELMMKGIQLVEQGVSATADPELYRIVMPELEKATNNVMTYIGMGPQFAEAMKHEKAMRSQQLQGTMMGGQTGAPGGAPVGPPPGPPPQQGPLG